MGASTDVMHEFVSQEIRRLYSTYDGWNVISRSQETNYDEVFSIQRFKDNQWEMAKVGVTFSKEVDPTLLDKIVSPASDGLASRFSSSLILPVNADASAVPGNVTVYRMRSFAFDGDSLIWTKKPVCESVEGSAKPASRQAA